MGDGRGEKNQPQGWFLLHINLLSTSPILVQGV